MATPIFCAAIVDIDGAGHVLLTSLCGTCLCGHLRLSSIRRARELSKRKKNWPPARDLTYIHEFRRAGYLPQAMVNFLALVGWSLDGETEFLNRDELIRHFSLEGVSKSPGAFSTRNWTI
jgi:glutamyl-tRNA synthetase